MKQPDKLFPESFLQKDSTCLLILSAFIFLLILPCIYWGIPDGQDFLQHFQFAVTYNEAIRSGDYLLSLATQTNFGLGDVGLRFYPPLSHYFLAVIQLFTNDWATSAWISFYFWMLLGSVGSYLLSREWCNPKNSLWVGIIYAIAPYHLSQIYQYFIYSEFAAAGILPFCFLFLTKVCRDGKLQDCLLLSLSVSLLILTHIPTTIIGIISLSLYAVIMIDWKANFEIVPKLILSGILTLLSTSFYWIKLVSEVNWVSHSLEKYSTGYFSYQRGMFPFFFNPRELYFMRLMWSQDIVAIFTIALFVPFILLVSRKIYRDRKLSKLFFAFFVTGAVPLFMSSRLSIWVWENLSFLQKIQFPWRWLSVATLFVSLTFVIAVTHADFSGNSSKIIKRYALLTFFLLLSLYNITQIILPAANLSQNAFDEKLSDLAEKESCTCWLPVWANVKAFEQKGKVLAQEREVKIIDWEENKRIFQVEAGNKTTISIKTFYYPHWKADFNGQPVEVTPNENGLISIAVPSEESEITLYFQEPLRVQIAFYASGLAWILIFVFLIYRLFQVNQFRIKDNSMKI